MKEEIRYNRRDLMKLYNISRYTLNEWVEKRGLNLIEISTHSQYISKPDLLEWENKMKKNNKFVNV
mgnify:FL=1|tara:strand:+ start:988 stop:1185 length:198 start_codon:yes stop_codon:yes gene_type:complete